jgi:hypothetical protein
MLISGAWTVDDDGVTRPYLYGEVRRADGTWREVAFLLDSGADQTVFIAPIFDDLGYSLPEAVGALHGFGGVGASVEFATSLRFQRDNGSNVTFNGSFAASVTPSALDTCALGREILNLFAVIVDRPGNAVLLLHPPHRYAIQAG